MNDNHRQRHQRQERPLETTTINLVNSPTSGARTRATQASHSRAIKPTRSHNISLAHVILAMWLLVGQIQTTVCGKMALAIATNKPAGAQTTFLGLISMASAPPASLGAQHEDHQRHPPRDNYRPPAPPATRAPAVPVESASLEAPPPTVTQWNCSGCAGLPRSSEPAQQSEWRQDMTTPTSRYANGLVKRDVELEEPMQQSPQPPPQAPKSLPQAYIAPTVHGVVTVGPRDKKPDRKKLEELKPADDVSKYLFKNFVPRWMDVCNRRPDRNDTIIRMYVQTWQPRSAEDIEAEILEFATHPNVTRLRAREELSRRKRATVNQVHEHLRHQMQQQQAAEHQFTRPMVSTPATIYHHHHHQQQQVYSFQASQKSAILFKSDATGYNKKHWSPKKTTFKLSQMKFTQHHLSRSKNRFFTQQPGDILNESGLGKIATTTTTSTPTTPQPKVAKPPDWRAQITPMTNALFHLDTRMSWQIYGSLSTIRKLRNNLKALNDTIEADKKWASQEPDVSDQRRAEILESRKLWFPKFEDMVTRTIGNNDNGENKLSSSLYNITGGLYKPQLRQLYTNMTEYLQYFGVAFEQMKFDQQHFYKRDWHHDERYRLVDRQLQEILCETENYLRLDREFQTQREEYLRLSDNFKLAPLSIREFQENFFAKFSNNSLRRDRPYDGQMVIESPVARAFERLEPEAQTKVLRKMDTFLPENRSPTKPLPEWLNEEDLPPPPIVRRLSRPTHLWREIMPLEQRQLYRLKERAIRDQSIIEELPPFLNSLESLLSDNYATS